jgi:4-alpha-glucanotransferase
MTGTHDTEPLAVWWAELGESDRAALLALDRLAGFEPAGMAQGWSPALRDAFLDVAYRAGSDDLFLPVQDLFGWYDRVNVPGTVGPRNWTWAMPWPVDRLLDLPECQDRAAFLRDLARTTARGPVRSAW